MNDGRNQIVDVVDLQVQLEAVLESVESGGCVTIVRGGLPIARFMPMSTTTREERIAAIERMRREREGRTLGMSARQAIEEGRRF